MIPIIHQVGELHGNLKQPERLDTLNRFKDGVIDVLVATDVAARGLDIVGVKTVINFELPSSFEHYIHRYELKFSNVFYLFVALDTQHLLDRTLCIFYFLE